MVNRRPASLCLAFAFMVCVSFPNLAQAQDATPVPVDDVCTFTEENPLVISGAENLVYADGVGIEMTTTFDQDCNPNTTFAEVAASEAGAETTAQTPVYYYAPGSWGQRNPINRMTTNSSVCQGSSRVHDVVHITLTQSRTYAKWYYDGSINTGRSMSASSTSEDHLWDGWYVTDGPWFYWYYLANPVGAEGWTGFAWIAPGYEIEHRVILWMYGYGGCYGDFYMTGSICGSCHIHTRYYINGG